MAIPNGITAAYSYDAASELTGIVYQGAGFGSANLAYGYDADGQRVGVSGSLATTQMPAAVGTAVYNADNQLTEWGSTPMTYDADGNTLNDGTNAYTWDARNHLVAANSNGATFVYDGLGRRFGKTMLSANTNFLYDGLNPVQELNGTTPTANLLTGGLDERFVRTDSNGTLNYLTDALGSTIALTDPSGNSDVQYGYDPYGNMTVAGSTTNSYAYTGSEFDGLGIDYYRARYYNPQTGRFLSEDPIGLKGGINKYAYTHDDPINYRDPSGRWVAGALIGFGNGLAFGALGAMTGDDWDWQDVVAGAVIGGFLGGGLGALDPLDGAIAGPVAGAVGDLAGQAFHKWRHGQNMGLPCYNWGEVGGAAIGGGLGGGLGLYLDGLGAAAGFVEGTEGYNALLFAENLLGNNVGLVSGALGGTAGNTMSGHRCGCQ